MKRIILAGLLLISIAGIAQTNTYFWNNPSYWTIVPPTFGTNQQSNIVPTYTLPWNYQTPYWVRPVFNQPTMWINPFIIPTIIVQPIITIEIKTDED